MTNWQDHCYLIHKRRFKDNYSWVYLLTQEHGFVAACIREKKQQKMGSESLITFGLYWCIGRESQILNINKIEVIAPALPLQGVAALSGLYINELIYTLYKGINSKHIFDSYRILLSKLILGGKNVMIALREFELFFLSELGYELPFSQIDDYEFYHFNPELGFVGTNQSTKFSFRRDELLAISNHEWLIPGVLSQARRLNKLAINHLLDGKQLQCYNWFME